MKKQTLITVFTALFILIFAGTVSAADWTVNPGDNIQTAIDGAGDDDTITVNDDAGAAYTYTQNILINKRNLTLKANGTVTLQTPNPDHPTIQIDSTGSYSTIQSFIISGSTNSANIRLNDGADYCNIIDNTINNCVYGIDLVSNNDHTLISGNTITSANGFGIYAYNHCTSNTISENTISVPNNAIYFNRYCNDNQIMNNILTSSNGIYLYYFSDNNNIEGNTVNNCNYGVTMDSSTGNTIQNNIITNSRSYGFWSNYFGNILTGNTIINNVNGVGLSNYVENGQYETIQYNRIANNSVWNLINHQSLSHGTPDARYNWWGSNLQSQVAAKISGIVTYDPWLYMTINANPNTIKNGVTSLITVSFNNYSSDGNTYTEFDPSVGHIPDGTPVTFSLTNGPFGTLTPPLTVNTVEGIASILFTATQTDVQDVNATTDNQKLMVNIPILGAHAALDIFFADYNQFVNNNYNIVPITGPVNYLDRVVVVSRITNMGPNSINWLQYLDSWSSHLTGTNDLWSSWDATSWGHLAYTPTGPHTENVLALISGHTQYVVIGAIVSASNTVITDTITTFSQTPADFEGFDTATASITVNLIATTADLYVNSESSNNNPTVGEIYTLTFKLGNRGPDTGENVVFTLPLPDGVEFVDVNVDQGTANYDPATRTITWTLGDVVVGDPYAWVRVRSLNVGSFIFRPTLTTDTDDSNLENSIQTVTVNVQAAGETTEKTQTVNAQTVEMHNTGIPLLGIVLAILMVLGGFIGTWKK